MKRGSASTGMAGMIPRALEGIAISAEKNCCIGQDFLKQVECWRNQYDGEFLIWAPQMYWQSGKWAHKEEIVR